MPAKFQGIHGIASDKFKDEMPKNKKQINSKLTIKGLLFSFGEKVCERKLFFECLRQIGP
jgi:hypothetical protein